MIFNENQVAPSSKKELEAYNTKNDLTNFMIFYSILDEILLMISSSNTVKEA